MKSAEWAAEWLSDALRDAERKVADCEYDVKLKKGNLRMAQHWLSQAVAKADAIRFIISSADLQRSAKPADTTEGGK